MLGHDVDKAVEIRRKKLDFLKFSVCSLIFCVGWSGDDSVSVRFDHWVLALIEQSKSNEKNLVLKNFLHVLRSAALDGVAVMLSL